MYSPNKKRQYHNLSVQDINDNIYHLIIDTAKLKRIPLNQEINEVLLNEFQPKYIFAHTWQYIGVTKTIKDIINNINQSNSKLKELQHLIKLYWNAKSRKSPQENYLYKNHLIKDFQYSNFNIFHATKAFLKFNRRFGKEFNLSGHLYNESYSKSTYRHLQKLALKARRFKAGESKIKPFHHLTVRMPEHLYVILKVINRRNNHVGIRSIIETAIISSPTIPHLILSKDDLKHRKITKSQLKYQNIFKSFYIQMLTIEKNSSAMLKMLNLFTQQVYKLFIHNPRRIIQRNNPQLIQNIDNVLKTINNERLTSLVSELNALKI